MDFLQIVIRLSLSVLIGGIIGHEREAKSRPAGMRTHILVVLGSTIIAMIQMEAAYWALEIATTTNVDAIRSDPVRLIAQVVSGIGFLGAGTIIFNKGKLTGLTTAASLWAVAAIGIANGMGFYFIALGGTVVMYITLSYLNSLISVEKEKKVEVRYIHRVETQDFLSTYFNMKNIEILDVDFNVSIRNDQKHYTTIYTINAPKGLSYAEIIDNISEFKNVLRIRVVSV